MKPDPFIIMCAPNGARKTRADHPALPITPAELADCAASILDAGAAVIHLHVRDQNDGHSLDVDRYRDAIDAIHDRVGDELVIQVTTEACGIYTPQQQMAMVRELQPEAVSLALRELCCDDAAESEAGAFFQELKERHILAQFILYSPDDAERFVTLQQRGVIPEQSAFVLLVLGRYSDDLTGEPQDLDGFATALGGHADWAVCCFGRSEQEAVTRAAAMRGHARVGFENNFSLPDGSVAKHNAQLVRLAADARGD
ncbi:MAG: 3-keto-5-aminohexanoate cleavage protein, partial [Woeseiaceae bacterium]